MALDKEFKDIPGTIVFDAEQSRKGYWLNQFCMSLMKAENRARFKANERAYLDEWKMTEEQKQAVLDRDLNRMMALGGNIYFLSKIGATDGKSFQQMAGSMTGMSEDDIPQDDGRGRPLDRGQPQNWRGRRRPAPPERLSDTGHLSDFKEHFEPWPASPLPSIPRTSPPSGRPSITAEPRNITGSRCSPDTTSTRNG